MITKIDLMDEGTNAMDLLTGEVYPLKLGYFGVKCRSQQNIIDNMSIKQAIANEKSFFANHPVYCQHQATMGIPFLSKQLNVILVAHIKKCIPTLNRQIAIAAQEKERELSKFSFSAISDDPLSTVDSGPLVLALINKFINAYSDKLEGRFVDQSAVEVQGGSRINYIFHKVFHRVVNEIDPFEHLSETDI